ncbi:MAG TPA: hypothetical protein VGR85_12305 [Candidatus Limnocylindria bacterium]|nr:hypothetical protein [Candidatus Limnocylindria bacterium]
MKTRSHRFEAVILSISLAVTSIVAMQQPASADSGACTANTLRKFAIACNYSATQWQGTYATWPSVPLNISSAAAANREFIDESLWLYENYGGLGGYTYLEVGDAAGGGKIIGHEGEWARMWYWVDGTRGKDQAIQNFIAYSPNDSMRRSYEIYWNGGIQWGICAETCPISVNWTDANILRPQTILAVGMEINNGGRELDSSKNSGTFSDQSMLGRYPSGSWLSWPTDSTYQIDSLCGVPPTCLQAWWSQPPPPYTNWNNGKPSQ